MLSVDLSAHPMAVANALRRTVLNKAPGEAVESVTIRTNTTPFWDEFLAHRIGLLVLRRVAPGETAELTLRVSGRAEATAADLRSATHVAVHPATPLAYVPEGGELDLTCHVGSGTGSRHCRFAPAFAYVDPARTLHIESHGGVAPQRVLRSAVEALRAEVREFCKNEL